MGQEQNPEVIECIRRIRADTKDLASRKEILGYVKKFKGTQADFERLYELPANFVSALKHTLRKKLGGKEVPRTSGAKRGPKTNGQQVLVLEEHIGRDQTAIEIDALQRRIQLLEDENAMLKMAAIRFAKEIDGAPL